MCLQFWGNANFCFVFAFLVARMDTTSGILIVLCLKSRISKDQDWLTDLITLDMFNWTLICWEDTTIGEEGVWSMEVQNTLFYGYYYCKEWREQHLICVEIAISCNSCIYWVYGRRLLNQLLETKWSVGTKFCKNLTSYNGGICNIDVAIVWWR